jgi:hypothetical protein
MVAEKGQNIHREPYMNPQWQYNIIHNMSKIDMTQQKVNPLAQKLTHKKIPIPPKQAVPDTKVTQPNS